MSPWLLWAVRSRKRRNPEPPLQPCDRIRGDVASSRWRITRRRAGARFAGRRTHLLFGATPRERRLWGGWRQGPGSGRSCRRRITSEITSRAPDGRICQANGRDGPICQRNFVTSFSAPDRARLNLTRQASRKRRRALLSGRDASRRSDSAVAALAVCFSLNYYCYYYRHYRRRCLVPHGYRDRARPVRARYTVYVGGTSITPCGVLTGSRSRATKPDVQTIRFYGLAFWTFFFFSCGFRTLRAVFLDLDRDMPKHWHKGGRRKKCRKGFFEKINTSSDGLRVKFNILRFKKIFDHIYHIKL